MNNYDAITGLVHNYDPATDVDEWIVCSAPAPRHLQVGRSTHTDFRAAKTAQVNLFLDKGIDAWIEYIPAFGPPGIEEQLNAARSLQC